MMFGMYLSVRTVGWSYYKCLFLKEFSGPNYLLKTWTILTADMFCHVCLISVPLPDHEHALHGKTGDVNWKDAAISYRCTVQVVPLPHCILPRNVCTQTPRNSVWNAKSKKV